VKLGGVGDFYWPQEVLDNKEEGPGVEWQQDLKKKKQITPPPHPPQKGPILKLRGLKIQAGSWGRPPTTDWKTQDLGAVVRRNFNLASGSLK